MLSVERLFVLPKVVFVGEEGVDAGGVRKVRILNIILNNMYLLLVILRYR